MAVFNKFDAFVEAIAEKKHDLGSDTLKVVLSNVLPLATNNVLANITQIANGNGYVTGGLTVTQTSSSQVGGIYKLVVADGTWVATGGSIGPFQYVAMYNDTAINDDLIGWWNYGTPLTITVGNSFTVDFDAINGVLTLT